LPWKIPQKKNNNKGGEKKRLGKGVFEGGVKNLIKQKKYETGKWLSKIPTLLFWGRLLKHKKQTDMHDKEPNKKKNPCAAGGKKTDNKRGEKKKKGVSKKILSSPNF